MPKVYADLHDSFMSRYLETSEPKIIGMERVVLCMKKVFKKIKKYFYKNFLIKN